MDRYLIIITTTTTTTTATEKSQDDDADVDSGSRTGGGDGGRTAVRLVDAGWRQQRHSERLSSEALIMIPLAEKVAR